MSEEAPIEANASTGMASTEGTIPKEEEVPATTDIPMEGFFNHADVIVETMASATVATTKEVLAYALVPPSRSVSTKESSPIKGGVIVESILISFELSTSLKADVPLMTTQLEKASPVTSSLVISANDPFTTLSQVV